MATQSALQSLLSAAPNGSTVRLPSGTTTLAAALVLTGKYGIRIVGADDAETGLSMQGNGPAVLFQNCTRCTLEKVYLASDKRAGGVGVSVQWDGASNFVGVDNRVVDCHLQFFETGVLIGDGSSNSTSENRVYGGVVEGCTSGVKINSGNAQNTVTRDVRFSGCGIGVWVALGGYRDRDSIFVLSSVSDVWVDNALHTTQLLGTYTEQSARFFYSSGPSGVGFPAVIDSCTIESGSPFTPAGWSAPLGGGRNYSIVHQQGSAIVIRNCYHGTNSYPLYVAIGGQVTTPLNVDGSVFYTDYQGSPYNQAADPFDSMADTMTVTGTYHLRDAANQGRLTSVRSRAGMVDPRINYLFPYGSPGYGSVVYRRADSTSHQGGTGDNSASYREDRWPGVPTIQPAGPPPGPGVPAE